MRTDLKIANTSDVDSALLHSKWRGVLYAKDPAVQKVKAAELVGTLIGAFDLEKLVRDMVLSDLQQEVIFPEFTS